MSKVINESDQNTAGRWNTIELKKWQLERWSFGLLHCFFFAFPKWHELSLLSCLCILVTIEEYYIKQRKLRILTYVVKLGFILKTLFTTSFFLVLFFYIFIWSTYFQIYEWNSSICFVRLQNLNGISKLEILKDFIIYSLLFQCSNCSDQLYLLKAYDEPTIKLSTLNAVCISFLHTALSYKSYLQKWEN